MAEQAKTEMPESVIKMITDVVAQTVNKSVGEKLEEHYKKMNEEAAKAKPPVDEFDLKALLASKFKGQLPDGDAKDTKGLNVARAVRYLMAGGGNTLAAAEISHRAGDTEIAKALGESTFTGGGALLPATMSNEIIELLAPQSVITDSDVTVVPMNNGTLTLPYVNTGASAAWLGENTNITASQPTAGQLSLRDHKLGALVPVSNDLIRSGGPAVDRMIRNDIVRAMRVKLDATLLRSLGTNYEPQGLRSLVLAANVVTANATVNTANVISDLGQVMQKLLDNDVMIDGCQWRFSWRTWRYLNTMLTTTGAFIFRQELETGKFLGFKYRCTSQIPNNIGGTSVGSELYFVNFSDLVLARNERLLVEAFPNGAYVDSNSTMQSGISSDQSVVRAISLLDFGARYRGKEIGMINDARWS